MAREFLLFGKPSVTLVVADATCLERNFILLLQILQITTRAVLCVNLVDEARAHGIDIDLRGLSRDLGIPVIGAAARRGEGLQELLAAVRDVATGKFVCERRMPDMTPPALCSAVEGLSAKLRLAYPAMENPAWIALRLLEGDPRIVAALKNGEFAV